jgi:hypothetical protein
MGSKQFYKAYLDRMEREGISNYDAGTLDGAAEANALDLEADRNANKAKSTAEWLKVDAQGNPTIHFETQEQMTLAIRDPLYQTSPAYRAAVESCIGRMADTRPNIEQGVAIGFNDASMIEVANADARRSEARKIFSSEGPYAKDAKFRADVATYIGTQKDSELVAQVEKDFTGESALQRAFRIAGSGRFGSDLSRAMSAEEGNGPVSSDEEGKVSV